MREDSQPDGNNAGVQRSVKFSHFECPFSGTDTVQMTSWPDKKRRENVRITSQHKSVKGKWTANVVFTRCSHYFFLFPPQNGWQRRGQAHRNGWGLFFFFFLLRRVVWTKVRLCQLIFLAGLTLTPLPMLFPKVIGGELQDRLIPVPYSKSATDQAVRLFQLLETLFSLSCTLCLLRCPSYNF